jgi:hypothetical protein
VLEAWCPFNRELQRSIHVVLILALLVCLPVCTMRPVDKTTGFSLVAKRTVAVFLGRGERKRIP